MCVNKLASVSILIVVVAWLCWKKIISFGGLCSLNVNPNLDNGL